MPRQRRSDGWFVEVNRASGAAVEYRWCERSRRFSRILGSVEEFPTDESRWKEVFRLELDQRNCSPKTINDLVEHWLTKECSGEDVDPNDRRAFSTRDNYRSYLRKWVIPRWGNQALAEVKAPAVCWRPRRDLNPCYRRERALSLFANKGT